MLKYERFKQTILQVIQQSGLDVGIVYFILKDIICEIETLYFQNVHREKQEQNQNNEETKEE